MSTRAGTAACSRRVPSDRGRAYRAYSDCEASRIAFGHTVTAHLGLLLDLHILLPKLFLDHLRFLLVLLLELLEKVFEFFD